MCSCNHPLERTTVFGTHAKEHAYFMSSKVVEVVLVPAASHCVLAKQVARLLKRSIVRLGYRWGFRTRTEKEGVLKHRCPSTDTRYTM